MSEEKKQERGRRRNRAEAAELVAEYRGSGLSQQAFCETHGIGLATLARYRKRQAQDEVAGKDRWLAVEVAAAEAGPRGGDAKLAVLLSGGRRIEVSRGFDARTLEQLVGVLERA